MEIWNDAATQIFYSSGVCFGGIITLASFNNRDHNVFRDAAILALGDCFTSMFSGSVVFRHSHPFPPFPFFPAAWTA